MNYYEERYRLTGRAAAGLAASALLVVTGFLWRLPVIFLPLGIGLALLTAQGAGVIDRARRTLAFRADEAGITLGAVPDKLTVRRGSRLFIPWADVERIVLYPVRPRGRAGHGAVRCIGVQRRATAEPLPWGNEQAPGCPVPGVPAWATRMVNGWRLDRDRLAAIIATVAPGTPILDTTTDPLPAGEEPGQENGTPEAGPAA
ncbi:MAG: hypothetical protein J2P30_27270 [Actinobacteria bacterium]|nr:hypothetical protein [Actinomycetota bacterium]